MAIMAPNVHKFLSADALFALLAAGSSGSADHPGQAVKADALFGRVGHHPAVFSAL